jgi:hypoxanthine-DNA glycosylase
VPPSVGFPPIEGPRAAVLILGSLPGQKSLKMRQYYAQPQNGFWRIMGELFGAGPSLPYAGRLARLIECRVAVWDVLAAGERVGSLDSAIVSATAVSNDFAAFFERHREIERICFNGAKAADLYRRLVLPTLPARAAALETRLLPSTSPAHAARPFAVKLALWAEALAAVALERRHVDRVAESGRRLTAEADGQESSGDRRRRRRGPGADE